MGGPWGESRQAVFAAARDLFAERGYSNTSVRDIARLAEVDPASVIRLFGSKDKLFLEAMSIPQHAIFPTDSDLDGLGRQIVRAVLEPAGPFRATFLGLVRASESPGVATVLARMHEEGFVQPLCRILIGQDAALRARLIAAMVAGLMYSLWIAEDQGLIAADPAELIEAYGSRVQLLIDG